MKRQNQSQLRELARKYNKTEDEIARLVQSLAPANLGAAGHQMLLGPAGIKQLLNILEQEKKYQQKARAKKSVDKRNEAGVPGQRWEADPVGIGQSQSPIQMGRSGYGAEPPVEMWYPGMDTSRANPHFWPHPSQLPVGGHQRNYPFAYPGGRVRSPVPERAAGRRFWPRRRTRFRLPLESRREGSRWRPGPPEQSVDRTDFFGQVPPTPAMQSGYNYGQPRGTVLESGEPFRSYPPTHQSEFPSSWYEKGYVAVPGYEHLLEESMAKQDGDGRPAPMISGPEVGFGGSSEPEAGVRHRLRDEVEMEEESKMSEWEDNINIEASPGSEETAGFQEPETVSDVDPIRPPTEAGFKPEESVGQVVTEAEPKLPFFREDEISSETVVEISSEVESRPVVVGPEAETTVVPDYTSLPWPLSEWSRLTGESWQPEPAASDYDEAAVPAPTDPGETEEVEENRVDEQTILPMAVPVEEVEGVHYAVEKVIVPPGKEDTRAMEADQAEDEDIDVVVEEKADNQEVSPDIDMEVSQLPMVEESEKTEVALKAVHSGNENKGDEAIVKEEEAETVEAGNAASESSSETVFEAEPPGFHSYEERKRLKEERRRIKRHCRRCLFRR
ncbi:MAG: hypothetical protein GX964_09620 [Syntrophomonadaceae bacterium]|jgi:hypothetical protein|nr:hypothetical protein [Syntrophomonadaceae bacterium]